MRKTVFIMLAMALVPFGALAVDGVVLINDSTVKAMGGYPYNITAPGSYKLSGNLVAPDGVSGIQILASNVTLDLNGFNISGPPQTCSPSACGYFYGIRTPFTQTGITVRNGTISGFGGQLGLGTTTCLVEDLILQSVPGSLFSQSFSSFGPSSIVRHVIADGQLTFVCPALGVEISASDLRRNGTSCLIFNFLGTLI